MRNLVVVLSTAFLFEVLMTPLPAGEAFKNVSRVLEQGRKPDDARLGKLRKLDDADHPWVPPRTKGEWEQQAKSIRERMLLSNGLWPMPPKTLLKPTIHGKIDRGDYTVEKVFFASHPGHYVTGNLYRPKNIKGQVAGILCPHGHWPNGRFYDAGEEKGRSQIDQGAEKTMAGARYPLQARMVQLARMGCVVFHYDMAGYADSQQISHPQGFTDVEAGLRLQNFMGLQTYNTIRALDFLTSLPDVDSRRIGVTGSSGGGTQTFMLCAIDPRPAVAFPAVMVSTGMQGGCICENASYLRQGINNIAIAALFAPKPLAMSGADDWTIAIETKGLPELRQVYSLYGKADYVHAQAFPQFRHNYNQVARELMYRWFNQHLDLGHKGPLVEEDFRPVAELSVFDDQHPLPKDARTAAELRQYLTKVAEAQFAEILPRNVDEVAEYRRVVATAARVMLDTGLPAKEDLEVTQTTAAFSDDLKLMKGTVGRKGAHEQIPFVSFIPQAFNGTAVLWVDGKGKSHLFDKQGNPTKAVQKLLDGGYAVVSADLFLTGEFLAAEFPAGDDATRAAEPAVDQRYHGYTFGYNRPLLSNRVRDILTIMAAVTHHDSVSTVHLLGTGEAGPWALLARALAGNSIEKTIVDARGFSFENVNNTADPMFLPGALKYGGLGGLAALAAPSRLTVAGMKGVSPREVKPLTTVYAAAKGELTLEENPLTPDAAVGWLLQ